VTDPDHLDLKTIRAKLLAEDQSTVTLVARTGQMDTKQQLLNLQKDIFLQTSTGYEARLSQAFIDMANGIVTSDEHVDVKLTNGTITSDRIKITGNGEVITFEGNVVMHLDHFDAGGTPAEPAAAPVAPEPAARPGKTRSSSSKTANTK
jgi:lipopolysaccharide export system protein LptC